MDRKSFLCGIALAVLLALVVALGHDYAETRHQARVAYGDTERLARMIVSLLEARQEPGPLVQPQDPRTH